MQTGKTEKVYMLIIDELEKMIVDRNLKPGDRLPSERAIAEALSVSRTSVRQAITALSEKGLVSIQRGSGVYLTKGSKGKEVLEEFSRGLVSQQINPVQIAEARQLIECETAYLCAKNCDEACCRELESLLDRTRLREGRGASYDEMNRDIHLAVAKGSGNPVLYILMKDIFSLMEENMWKFAKSRNIQRLEILNLHLDQHEALVAAITHRDADMAREIMSQHLTNIDNEMTVLFKGQDEEN